MKSRQAILQYKQTINNDAEHLDNFSVIHKAINNNIV